MNAEANGDTDGQAIAPTSAGKVGGDGGGSTELQSLEALFRLAAFHQAGHTVIAQMLGARVLCVELSADPLPRGTTRVDGLDDPDGSPSDHGLVRRLAYTMAGPIAESIAEAGAMALQGDPGYRAATAIMNSFRHPEGIDEAADHGTAARLLLDHFGDGEVEAAAAVDHLAMSVEGWVWDHWPVIAMLAARLLRDRCLAADDLRSIVPPEQINALPRLA